MIDSWIFVDSAENLPEEIKNQDKRSCQILLEKVGSVWTTSNRLRIVSYVLN